MLSIALICGERFIISGCWLHYGSEIPFLHSNDKNHLEIAHELAQWISGENDANRAIYSPNTGICFDGITGPNEVNKNSGAESTLETLLMLIEIERLK